MRVIVCGSRLNERRDFIFSKLDAFHALTPITLLIEGGQRLKKKQGSRWVIVGGVDYWANQWARSRKVNWRTEYANWNRFGKGAGPIRNMEMLVKHEPNLVLAFPGGPGTENMVKQANQMKVRVQRIA